jgi:folate-binding protein YgfZ
VTILDALARRIVVEEDRRTLRVTGKDAVTWLNGLVTCDVASADGRRAVYGLLLTKQGKVVTDLEVVKSDAALLLGIDATVFDSVRELLDRYLVMEDAELESAPELSWLHVVGEEAAQVASTFAVARGSSDWLRAEGTLLVVRSDQRKDAMQELTAGGAVRAGASEWELVRLALAFPKFGVDYGSDDNPHQASLERRAVSWSKGCYLGQEVVCMQDMRGRVKRRLVLLEVARVSPSVGNEVRVASEAEPVGRITSVASDGERAFCMAQLRAPFFEGSSELEVLGAPARIVAPKRAG